MARGRVAVYSVPVTRRSKVRIYLKPLRSDLGQVACP